MTMNKQTYMPMSNLQWEQFSEGLKIMHSTILENAEKFAQANGIDADTKGRHGTFDLRFDDYGDVILATEYNDSCNCHPECQTWTKEIPVETIRQMMCGEDWITPIQSATLKRQEEHRLAMALAASLAEKKAIRERETAERAQFEKLKAKYDK
jgi:hypothetical protein